MKKIFYAFPIIVIAGLFIYQAVRIKQEISVFENELRISYHYSGFLGCEFPSSLNPEFKRIYTDSCKITRPEELQTFIDFLKTTIPSKINSPLIRMRPFRAQNVLLSQYTNKEYYKLRDFLLSFADTENSIAQVNGNFMEADCSHEMMNKYLGQSEDVKNQFTRMFLLSEIKSCMFINNEEDQTLISRLIALSPLEIEDESAGTIQLKEYLIDQNFVLGILPKSIAQSIAESFIPVDLRKMLTDLDVFFYYDELSQLYYLKNDFNESLRYTNLALDMKIKKYNIEHYNILNYMALARLGKVYLQLNRPELSKQVMAMLDQENVIYKRLPEMYYIDLSLAELFLQTNDRRPALEYLETAYKKNYIPENLFTKWKTEIQSMKTAKLELDMFRFKNKKSIESKIFKNEENQIILFKDKLEGDFKSLQ